MAFLIKTLACLIKTLACLIKTLDSFYIFPGHFWSCVNTNDQENIKKRNKVLINRTKVLIKQTKLKL